MCFILGSKLVNSINNGYLEFLSHGLAKCSSGPAQTHKHTSSCYSHYFHSHTIGQNKWLTKPISKRKETTPLPPKCCTHLTRTSVTILQGSEKISQLHTREEILQINKSNDEEIHENLLKTISIRKEEIQNQNKLSTSIY